MQYLDSFSAVITALGGDATLKSRVDDASKKLKDSLLNAVRTLHPEHVFKIPEDQSRSCSNFLRRFLDTGGNIFSTNYDLLLYWVLLRNSIINHVDGCGRELENPGDELLPPEDQVWSELIWGKYKNEQNVHYLHGALPFFDSGPVVTKEEYDSHNYLLSKIGSRMERGQYPIFVAAGDGRQKLTHIAHNQYLSYCYNRLCRVDGSIVTFGFSFGESDQHLIDAINKATKFRAKSGGKLFSIYIGIFSDGDLKHIEGIADQFKCKVRVYDAKTANIWRGET